MRYITILFIPQHCWILHGDHSENLPTWLYIITPISTFSIAVGLHCYDVLNNFWYWCDWIDLLKKKKTALHEYPVNITKYWINIRNIILAFHNSLPSHNWTRIMISTCPSYVTLKGPCFYLFIISVIVRDVSLVSPRSHLMEGPALFLLANAFLMISCSKCYGKVSLIAGRALESHG